MRCTAHGLSLRSCPECAPYPRRIAYRYACQACAHGLLGTVGPESHGDDCEHYINPERAYSAAYALAILGAALGPVAATERAARVAEDEYMDGWRVACGIRGQR